MTGVLHTAGSALSKSSREVVKKNVGPKRRGGGGGGWADGVGLMTSTKLIQQHAGCLSNMSSVK